jgi:hypothetical protein
LIAEHLFAPALRDRVSRSWQRGYLIQLRPEKDPLRATPKPPEGCVIVEELRRIIEE